MMPWILFNNHSGTFQLVKNLITTQNIGSHFPATYVSVDTSNVIYSDFMLSLPRELAHLWGVPNEIVFTTNSNSIIYYLVNTLQAGHLYVFRGLHFSGPYDQAILNTVDYTNAFYRT
jgi:hypothetical protein